MRDYPKTILILNGHKYVTRFFLPIADAAKNNNFEVDLFIPKKTTDLTFSKNFFSNIFFFNFNRTSLNIFSFFYSIVSFVIKDFKTYEVIHAVSTKVILIFMLSTIFPLKRLKNKIIIFHFIGLGRLLSNNKGFGKLLRFTMKILTKFLPKKNSYKIIYLNEEDGLLLKSIFPHHKFKFSKIMGAGVDTNKFSYFEREAKRPINILFIGRLIKEKGLEVCIKICEKLKKNFDKKFIVNIVGSFEDLKYKEKIFEKVSKSSIKNEINFIGEVENPLANYNSADLLLFPSNYGEGVPTVILEALSTGLPTIASDISGCKEVIKNDFNGYLIEISDIEKWCHKIIYLIENNEKYKYLSINGRETVKESFKISYLAKKTVRLYLS